MGPTESLSLPPFVVVVAGPPFGSNICKNYNLGLVLNYTRIPGATLGILG